MKADQISHDETQDHKHSIITGLFLCFVQNGLNHILAMVTVGVCFHAKNVAVSVKVFYVLEGGWDLTRKNIEAF